MSHFYGIVKGARGKSTRCGTRASGMETHTASWAGAVRVKAYYDKETETDMVRVELVGWPGCRTLWVLYDGPISGPDRE
jgi:hypothetical protein